MRLNITQKYKQTAMNQKQETWRPNPSITKQFCPHKDPNRLIGLRNSLHAQDIPFRAYGRINKKVPTGTNPKKKRSLNRREKVISKTNKNMNKKIEFPVEKLELQDWLRSSMSIELKPQGPPRGSHRDKLLSQRLKYNKSSNEGNWKGRKNSASQNLHRKGKSQVLMGKRTNQMQVLNNKLCNSNLLGKFLSGVNSLESLGYRKVYEAGPETQHTILGISYLREDPEEFDEMINKIAYDTEEMKDNTTYCSNPLPLNYEHPTYGLISKYIDKNTRSPWAVLKDSNDEEEGSSNSVMQMLLKLKESDCEPKQGNNKNGILATVNQILTVIQSQKIKKDRNRNGKLISYMKAPELEDFRFSSIKDTKWLSKTLMFTPIIKIDKFLRERMFELITENLQIRRKSPEEDLNKEPEENSNFDKWAMIQIQKIRNARDLIKNSLQLASNSLGNISTSKIQIGTAGEFSQIKNSQSMNNLKTFARRKITKTKLIMQGSLKSSPEIGSEIPATTDTLPVCISRKQELQSQSSHQSSEHNSCGEAVSSGTQNLFQKLLSINLSSEMKEDLLEFIFLDLSIELIDEFEADLFINNPIFALKKKLKDKENKENKENSSVLLDQSRKRKGFGATPKDTMTFAMKFVHHLLLQENIDEIAKTALKVLRKPVGPEPLQLLRFIRGYDPEEEEGGSNTQVEIMVNNFVIQVKWYEEYYRVYSGDYDFGWYFEEPEKEAKRVDFMKKAMNIHHKAIFDALNQCLDKSRPFGIIGEPYPWKPRPTASPQSRQLKNIFQKACNILSQNCKMLCGIIKDDSLLYQLSQLELEQIREDRMFKLLCQDIQQSEQKWVFYDDEQTQFQMQIALLIFNELTQEFCLEMP